MTSPTSRRSLLAAPFALVGCTGPSPYFGRTTPPGSQRLVHSNGEEPSSLDPAQSIGAGSDAVIAGLLDSLTALSPLTQQPAAALATHYEVDSRGTQYTFFLRGHPKPRGIRLPNTDSLPREFTGGRKAPPDRTPALWSDGTSLTAHDFVYSWRRLVDPGIAAPMAPFYLACLGNADDIIKGAKPPKTLAVRALDEFTFQFELTAPRPSFLRVLWQPLLAAAPRHSIEAARRRGRESSWTMPGTYVSSGPFLLREWKAHDRVVLTRNPYYWEAQCVAIEEIVFLPVASGTTNVNLYKAGALQSINPWLIPPLLVPALKKKRDFSTSPAFRSLWYSLDTSKPPLDRLRVRYALNLATNKAAIAKFLAAGQRAANGVVPPLPGYPPLELLQVPMLGQMLNILAFDPRTARELLVSEGIPSLELWVTIPARTRSRDIAPIVQQQWREHLGVRLNLVEVEEMVWEQNLTLRQYRHAIEESWTAFCDDPNDFLGLFRPSLATSIWRDTKFDHDFTVANRLLDPAERMKALAKCEVQLIESMPVIPIFHDTWTYLEAPYVLGVKPNPFGAPRFKYASIDTHWRPS
jgi:oligopeptide transport system substrate-binding protein